ncbi:tyrosine-type recombinase/integrase [Priestia megaterium]|uniref:tyrosine-type recombinase/integrase n=1 Tax=Priestia megaterium TaxID=1404 RepID=UPI002E1A1938|nr:tyrosine-type recombinase/integrase [Priestia megaterium]MED4618379.1 tyrosine-type recombinase/integrase [Priestia megaterium]
MLLKFALQDFIDDREFKNLSPKTIVGYKDILNQFVNYCNENEAINVQDITPNTIKKYLMYCKNELGNNPTSLNHKLNRVNAFLNYLVEIEVIDKNPAKKVKRVKEDIRIEVFTDYHIKQMLNYYRRIKQREKAFYAYRDYSIIVTFISTGIRLSELCSLKWSDINFKDKSISVYSTKARKYETIPATEKLIKELANYKVYCEQEFKELSDHVYTNRLNKPMTANAVQNVFKRLAKVMNFKDVRLTAHTFRHSFCQRCIQSGMSTFAVQKLMRHSSIAVTERYSAMWGNDLREQNDKHNPLNNLEI